MVTFRNNNNVEEIILEEMIEILKLMDDRAKYGSNFQIMIIFKEKFLEEIIIMLQIN